VQCAAQKLLLVIVSQTEKGEIDRASLAGYVDRLRLGPGLDQLFGTEITARGEPLGFS